MDEPYHVNFGFNIGLVLARCLATALQLTLVAQSMICHQ